MGAFGCLFWSDASIMADLDDASHRSIAPSTLPLRAITAGAAWRIPPLIFARFLFGCSADTKPYMDCAGRRATDRVNRETAEEAWSHPNDRRPRHRSHRIRAAKSLDLEQGKRRSLCQHQSPDRR